MRSLFVLLILSAPVVYRLRRLRRGFRFADRPHDLRTGLSIVGTASRLICGSPRMSPAISWSRSSSTPIRRSLIAVTRSVRLSFSSKSPKHIMPYSLSITGSPQKIQKLFLRLSSIQRRRVSAINRSRMAGLSTLWNVADCGATRLYPSIPGLGQTGRHFRWRRQQERYGLPLPHRQSSPGDTGM